MKKFLLMVLACGVSSFSLAQVNPPRVDYDAAINYCIKNNQPVCRASSDGSTIEVWDHSTKQYIPTVRFNAQYGVSTFNELCTRYTRFAKARKINTATFDKLGINPSDLGEKHNVYYPPNINHHQKKAAYRRDYAWKLKPANTVIGASLVGVSAASYMLANSILNNKLSKLNNDLSNALGQSNADANKVKQIGEKINSNNKAKNTIGYVCAGVSVAGVIVVLSGLHKEYDGIKIANNLTINDTGGGVNITKRF